MASVKSLTVVPFWMRQDEDEEDDVFDDDQIVPDMSGQVRVIYYLHILLMCGVITNSFMKLLN